MDTSAHAMLYNCDCGVKVRYGDAHVGRTLRCKNCQSVFTLPPPVKEDDEDDASVVYAVAAPEVKLPSADGAWVDPSRVRHRGELAKLAPLEGGVGSTAISVQRQLAERRRHGFWHDAFACYTFWTKPANAFTLVLLTALVSVSQFVPVFLFLIGLILYILVQGVVIGFYFRIVAETAGGEDDLPRLDEWESMTADVLVPLLNVFLLFIMLGLPAAIAGGYAQRAFEGSGGPMGTILAWACYGAALFLVPASVLIVAINGPGALLRMDLVIRTAFSAFVPYVTVCGLIALATVLQSMAMGSGLETMLEWLPDTFLTTIAVLLAINLGSCYFMIVAAKTIGLYYRHFSDRFPWSAG